MLCKVVSLRFVSCVLVMRFGMLWFVSLCVAVPGVLAALLAVVLYWFDFRFVYFRCDLCCGVSCVFVCVCVCFVVVMLCYVMFML